MAVIAVDDFASSQYALSSPVIHAASTAGDDTNDLVHASRAISVGGAGNIPVITLGGETVTLVLPAGFYPIRLTRVKATGLTATGVVVYW